MKVLVVSVLAAASSAAAAATLNVAGRGVHSYNTARGSNDTAQQFGRLVESITQTHASALDANAATLAEQGIEANCTSDNIVVRREYGSLSKAERREYVRAVQCLQALPPNTPANVSAGARSRFDDFVVTHIQQTLTIHYTGNFLPWHRWFVHTYETALRDECGYTGYQPYWDWPRYASAPQDSPIFDGSDTSLGGNGQYIEGHNGSVITPPDGLDGESVQLAAGLGGGYVTTGPFANMSVNLGPSSDLDGVAAGANGGLGYNPRRLKRDIGPAINTAYANYTTVLDLLSKPNISEYRLLLEGIPFDATLGPHGGGHYVINGDPGGDLYTSPGDPAFYVHHGMIDRMWSLWQAIDPETRHVDLDAGTYGHVTWTNDPVSDMASLDDVLDMGYAGPSTTIRNVMDTTSGPFCYFYA